MKGGEPFFFPGGQTGCLLIHGFTGTPKEMRWMGEHLADQGYSVLGPRLYGHATEKREMIRARWGDWVTSALDGYQLLLGACSQVIVMGLSMGGVLALYLGAHYPVAGIVAMGTPYVIPHRLMRTMRPIVPLASMVYRFHAKGPDDWRDSKAAEDHLEYDAYPVRPAVEVHKLLAEMRQVLPLINTPVLLIHSKEDKSVGTEHALAIHKDLTSCQAEILWIENSGHVVNRDAERGAVFTAATDFVHRVTGGKL